MHAGKFKASIFTDIDLLLVYKVKQSKSFCMNCVLTELSSLFRHVIMGTDLKLLCVISIWQVNLASCGSPSAFMILQPLELKKLLELKNLTKCPCWTRLRVPSQSLRQMWEIVIKRKDCTSKEKPALVKLGRLKRPMKAR